MKCRSVQKLGLLASLGVGAAVATPDGVVQLAIQRRNVADSRPILPRASSSPVLEQLQNDRSEGAYMAEVKVGTPPQTLTLQLDTGSSDTWVVSSGAEICEQGQCDHGSFDRSQSNSYTVLAKDAFSTQYADKTSAQGDYFNDVFSIGSVTLQNLTMGIGLETDIPFGLVGVGYPSNEAGVAEGTIDAYPNLPLQLVKEGFTNTVAFSMWLNDLDASAGNILFGGIDTAKFEGPLTRVKLYPTHRQSAVDEFAVALTSVTAVSKSGSDKLGSASFPAPVILDSGTTVSFLPEDLVAEIYREANVITDDSGTGAVPCSYANAQGYFSFGFGGPGGAVVNVSMSELVLGVAGTITGGSHKGQDACTFGIQAVSSNDTFILGDTFLRSAFVVYDLVNNEAALAQTKFNVSDSNVIAFASLSATVPSSTPAPSQDAISQGVVTATPASYAAAAAFTASSGAAGPLGPGGGVAGVALATLVSFGVGVFSFFVL